MPFKKGKSGNPNGRVEGSQNKVTQDLRVRFKEFADNNFSNCQEWLDRIALTDPDKALNLYLQLTERVIGKAPQQIDITSNGKTLRAPIINAIGTPPEGH
jgi:hypothetical protein